MLYTANTTVLKKDVNKYAIQVLTVLSKKYSNYRFYVTGIDTHADNLPSVATIVTEDVPDSIIYAINTEYTNMLTELLNANNACPPKYAGMNIMPLKSFDTKWFESDELCFYVWAGEFYKEVYV